ncbi:hypothetical protein [uncultured Treponema sp.]|uniref:hypothetical protein n=1 Tax=uncultured Treponema sp. TaxID=162155 RepID=UPI0025E9F2B9|nr:hypothetical protein [uncultured Treponema sp.]
MDFVKNKSDLICNVRILDSYLTCDDEKRIFAEDLIRHGHCFMFMKKKGEIHFYPSRFMGYLNDTKEKYEESKREKKNPEKRPGTVDGRKTNRVICSILHCPLQKDSELEKEYLSYCKKYGIEADKRVHTFWKETLNF